jgi:branched-chain amino acid transport system permease protein
MIAFIFDASVVSANFWINVGVTVGLAGIFTVGIQLNAGSSGIINVGQGGFMAIGAYGTALLVTDAHVPLLLAILGATAIATAAGLALGAVAVRLRADYFAIATIAFAEIVRTVIVNETRLAGGNQGLFGFDGGWSAVSTSMSSAFERLGIHDAPLFPLLVITWALFITLLILLRYLVHSPWGRNMAALREDEHAAESLGKNTFVLKLQSVGIAAACGSLSGAIFALQIKYLVPTEFDATITFLAYAALILGGLGSYTGVLVGTIIVYALLQLTTFLKVSLSVDQLASVRFIVVGVVLVALCLLRPQGLLGSRAEMLARD